MAKNKSTVKKPGSLCKIQLNGTFTQEGIVFPAIPTKLHNMVLQYREAILAGIMQGNKSKAEAESVIREEFRTSYRDAFQEAGGTKQKKNPDDYFCSTLLGTDGVTAYQERNLLNKRLTPELRDRIWQLSDTGHHLTTLRQDVIDETYANTDTDEDRYNNIVQLLNLLEDGKSIPSRSKKNISRRNQDTSPDVIKPKPFESETVVRAHNPVNHQAKEDLLKEVYTYIKTQSPSDSTDSEKKRLSTDVHVIMFGALNEIEVLIKSARITNRKESYRKEGVSPQTVAEACEWFRVTGASMGVSSKAKCPDPFYGKSPIEIEDVTKIFRAVAKTHHTDHNPNGDIEKLNTANNHRNLLIAYNQKIV